MNNLQKIQNVSKKFLFFFSALLIAIPLYYLFFWIFINHIPETFITVNMPSQPLAPNTLSIQLRLLGLLASLLPLSAQMYGLLSLRKLFAYYKEGLIFTYLHVKCFRNVGRALILWGVVGVFYRTLSTLLFTWGNPPGQKILEIKFTALDFTALTIGFIVLVVAWVMDEGRRLNEEQALTV